MNGNILIYHEMKNNENSVGGLLPLLTGEGFKVVQTCNYNEISGLFDNGGIQLIIVNWGTEENYCGGKYTEYDNMRELNDIRNNYLMPIIVAAKRLSDSQRIMAFNSGADDIICEGMNPLEMTARIKAHIIRAEQMTSFTEKNNVYQFNDLIMDDNYRNVTAYGNQVNLTPVEYKILRFLLINKGKIFSNEEIYSNIWKLKPINSNNTVAVHIRHIREKIERDPNNPMFIKSSWGSGYKVG